MKDYSSLHRTYEYDKEKATLLAEAMTEVIELEARQKYLRGLLDDNESLKPFLWKTQAGKVIALHDLDDDHLRNIVSYTKRRVGYVSPQLEAEALSRGILIEVLELTEGESLDWSE